MERMPVSRRNVLATNVAVAINASECSVSRFVRECRARAGFGGALAGRARTP